MQPYGLLHWGLLERWRVHSQAPASKHEWSGGRCETKKPRM